MRPGKFWLCFLTADNDQEHVTSTLRKNNVHSRMLDPTLNKYSRNLHSVLFVRAMIGGEGSLLSVIRYPSKDDAANKDLHNNTGNQHSRQAEVSYSDLQLMPRAPTDRGVLHLCLPRAAWPSYHIHLWQAHPPPQLYPNFEQLLHSRSIKKENSLDVSHKHDSLVIINIQKAINFILVIK